MQRNIKLFLFGSVPFGTLTGAFYSFQYNLKIGLISGLISGVVFGFLMFIILGVLHGRAVGKVVNEKSEETMGIHHVRKLELQISHDKAFDRCIESLDLIKNCNIREQDRSHGKIVAKTTINWKTWGDTISFDVAPMDNGHIKIDISSRPTARTTLVDFGKNLENVEKIKSFLENSVGAIHELPLQN